MRNTGYIYRVCHGDLAARWNYRRVDSRTSRFTNKALLEQIEKDYGEDSDMFRVRMLGLPPRASELQYIDGSRVALARKRTLPRDRRRCRWSRGFDVSGGKAWERDPLPARPRWRQPAPADSDPRRARSGSARSASACARSC